MNAGERKQRRAQEAEALTIRHLRLALTALEHHRYQAAMQHIDNAHDCATLAWQEAIK